MKKSLIAISLVVGCLCFTSCKTVTNNEDTNEPSGPNNPGDSNTDNNDNNNPSGPGDDNDSSGPNTDDKKDPEEVKPLPFPELDHIKVLTKVPEYKYCYAWTYINGKKVEPNGKWPGKELTSFGVEYKAFDFEPKYTEIDFIFNESSNGKKTEDLKANGAGYHWYDDKTKTITKSNFYPTNKPNKPSNPDSGNSNDYTGVNATSYKELAIWDKMDKNPSYYKVQNPYNGLRKDFREETIYFAITTRFYDGDASNNKYTWKGFNTNKRNNDPDWRGDFKGLIERLDYIKALGFTSIWITPIVENTSESDFHGYHATNFSKVDSRYESDDVKFEDLIKEVHKRDMKLILDIVINHTSNYGETNLFPLMEKVPNQNPQISDDVKALDNGNIKPNEINAWNKRIEALDDRNKDIYHKGVEVGKRWNTIYCQTGRIAGDCVDLNTENPIVANYLIDCYGEFIRLGVDAFRIDTFKHVSRLTWNNYYLPSFYEYAKRVGNDNFFIFGEVLSGGGSDFFEDNCASVSTPFYTWKEDKEYPWGDKDTNLESTKQAFEDHKEKAIQPISDNAFLKNGFEYHTPNHNNFSGASVIDAPMHFKFNNAKQAFDVALEGDKYYNDATYNVVYVDSHDKAPEPNDRVRFNGGTDAWAENLSLMFTFRGIPCLYYGSEIEFQKGKTIDNYNMPLKDTGRAYFGDNLEGTIQTSGFGEFEATGAISETLNSTLSKHIRDLNKIRSKVPALSLGQYQTSGIEGSDVAFIRRYKDANTDSLALVTVSQGATFKNIPNGNYVDVVTGDRIVVSNNSLKTTGEMSKGNMRCYVLENSTTGALSKLASESSYLK